MSIFRIQYFKGLKNELTGQTPMTIGPRMKYDTPLVHHVESANDFDDQVKNAGSKLVVVDFYTQLCLPCKHIYPTLTILADKYRTKMVVLKVDADEHAALSKKYHPSGMPTFLFFKNGEKIEEFTGADRKKLEHIVKALVD